MKFEFATSQRILFGTGIVKDLGKLAGSLGRRALLVCGSGNAPFQSALESLNQAGLAVSQYPVLSEPDLAAVQNGLNFARSEACDVIVGIGGGSVMDCAKALAALLANRGNILDYLEVVGKGLPLSNPSLPMLAVPTTAGTGAEVTRNAVIAVPEQKVKVSMRSPYMLPKVALVDPELTYSTPPAVTAGSGLDALTQNIEAYTTLVHNPITDSLAREGITRAARSLKVVYDHGDDAAAREDMALASLFGGLCLANSGLGAVHGFAGVLGGMYNAPHGPICGRLLPGVMRANIQAFESVGVHSFILERYLEISRLLCGDPEAGLLAGSAWLEETIEHFQIKRLGEYGVKLEALDEIVTKSQAASSMKKNPIVLSGVALRAILEEAL